jgi:hypothetical protein
MQPTDKTTDYGDLLESMIATQKANRAEKAKQDADARETKRLRTLDLLRPFITMLRQTKERFPCASIFDLDCHGEGPQFYTDGETKIHIAYKEDENKFTLRRQISRYGHYSNEVFASSEHAEDLIPEVLKLLLLCVQK